MSWFGADIHEIVSSSPEQIHSSMLTDDSGKWNSTSLSQTMMVTSEEITYEHCGDITDNSLDITNMERLMCNGKRDHCFPITTESDDMPDLWDSILSTIFEKSEEHNS